MADTQRAHEPTMEEILASIRRIISDDETAAEPAVVEDEEAPSEDVDMQAEGKENSNEDVDALFEADADGADDENSNEDVDALFAADADADKENSNEDVDALFADTADEVAAEAEEAPAEPEPDSESEEDGVLELTDEMAAPDVEGDDGTGDGLDALLEDFGVGETESEELPTDDVAFQDMAEEEEPAPVNSAPPRERVALMSADAQSSASSAFGVLASTMLSHSGGARTLEQIVEDMLKPLLKAWLDESLPPLVERLVREEIDRVARQAR